MKDLTVSEIKKKMKFLEKDIKDLLNEFEKETGVLCKGEINHQYKAALDKMDHYVHIKYSNPLYS